MYENILLISILFLSISQSIPAQRIKGSDTVLPLTQEWAETFMKEYPGAAVTVTGGGSGVGISAIMEGTTDIAMASRRIKFGEKIKTKQNKMELWKNCLANVSIQMILKRKTTKIVMISEKCSV